MLIAHRGSISVVCSVVKQSIDIVLCCLPTILRDGRTGQDRIGGGVVADLFYFMAAEHWVNTRRH